MADELIKGAAALERALLQLPAKISKKVVRQAVRKAQKPMLAQAKENARGLIGGEMGAKIAKQLKIKGPKRQKKGQYLLGVQIKADDDFVHVNKDGKRHYIPAAIEFGHGPNKENMALAFMRKAADSKEAESHRIAAAELASGIEREAKLLAK